MEGEAIATEVIPCGVLSPEQTLAIFNYRGALELQGTKNAPSLPHVDFPGWWLAGCCARARGSALCSSSQEASPTAALVSVGQRKTGVVVLARCADVLRWQGGYGGDLVVVSEDGMQATLEPGACVLCASTARDPRACLSAGRHWRPLVHCAG